MFRLDPRDVESSARRAAGWLRARGVRAGDRVAVVSGNHPGYLPLTMGALRTGIVPVLVNAHLPPAERARILRDAEPALVCGEDARPACEDASPADLAPHPLARPMHYTSGTTGLSKGVWSGVLTEDEAAALAADEQELWGAGPGDAFLVCSPLYHSAPHRSALSALSAGARVILAEAFDAAGIGAAIRDERVTGAFLVPTHLRRLLAVEADFRSMRRALHAGEPCPEALKRRTLEAFPPGTVWEFYGSTEGQFTLIAPDEWTQHPGSVGRARTGRVLDIEEPDADGVGAIYVRAPSFARWRYWRDPENTARAWRGDAFTVGDLGRLDDDGYLYLSGRREDLIITGGVNVYPGEVERVLLEHPAVAEAAVFGVPDPEWGRRVCAAVVLADPDHSPERIREWTRGRLAPAQRPKEVLAVDSLPRTATGKVRRADLARSLPGEGVWT